MGDCWRRLLVRLGALSLFAVLGSSFYLTLGVEVKRPEEGKKAARGVRREEELCAGLALSQLPDGTRDVMRAGRIVTRRMRKGPFCLAAKEMVISDLYLCLPPSCFQPPPAATNAAPAAASAKAGGSAPQEMEGALDALSKGGGRMRELMPNVAGAIIRNLRIDRQEGEKSVPWLEAQRAQLGERVLKLDGPVVYSNGVRRAYAEGLLEYRPYFLVHSLR